MSSLTNQAGPHFILSYSERAAIIIISISCDFWVQIWISIAFKCYRKSGIVWQTLKISFSGLISSRYFIMSCEPVILDANYKLVSRNVESQSLRNSIIAISRLILFNIFLLHLFQNFVLMWQITWLLAMSVDCMWNVINTFEF